MKKETRSLKPPPQTRPSFLSIEDTKCPVPPRTTQQSTRSGAIPARMWDRTCTWGVHRAQFSHPCRFQRIFYTAGRWSPSHSIIHIVPLIKKNWRDYSAECGICRTNEWLQPSTDTGKTRLLLPPQIWLIWKCPNSGHHSLTETESTRSCPISSSLEKLHTHKSTRLVDGLKPKCSNHSILLYHELCRGQKLASRDTVRRENKIHLGHFDVVLGSWFT